MKTFGVRFYTANFDSDAPKMIVVDTLERVYDGISSGNLAPQVAGDDGCKYEIRELYTFGHGASFRGVLAVVRDDAPHIRSADGTEREIRLEDKEGVLEKNYFLFFRKHNLLVWQVNARASHVMRFERYLTSISSHTIAFDHVIDRNALDRIKTGSVTRIHVRVAMPQNAQAYDPTCGKTVLFR